MNSRIFTFFLWSGLMALTTTWSVKAASDHQSPATPQANTRSKQVGVVEYFLNQPITASTGRDNIPWGEFQMCVKFSEDQNHKYISLWNLFTKPGQWLVIGPSALHQQSSSKLEFKSTDNWDNGAIGGIEFIDGDQIRIEIRATKPSEDLGSRNILGQYGTFTLTKAPCPYARFFEQLRP